MAFTGNFMLGSDLLADQANKGEFSEPRQDQQASPVIEAAPQLLGSTLSHHYNATNTDPAATRQSDGCFNSLLTDSLPAPTHDSRLTPFPPPRKAVGLQIDSPFNSSPAASFLSARTRYAPYRLPRRRPTSLPAHKFTGFPSPAPASRCLHLCMIPKA